MTIQRLVPVKLPDILTQGNNYVFPFLLTQGGSIYNPDGFTLTATIREEGGTVELISDHALAIVSGAAGSVTLTLTKAESGLLVAPDSGDPYALIWHVMDVLSVESSLIDVHLEPMAFRVRRKITGA